MANKTILGSRHYIICYKFTNPPPDSLSSYFSEQGATLYPCDTEAELSESLGKMKRLTAVIAATSSDQAKASSLLSDPFRKCPVIVIKDLYELGPSAIKQIDDLGLPLGAEAVVGFCLGKTVQALIGDKEFKLERKLRFDHSTKGFCLHTQIDGEIEGRSLFCTIQFNEAQFKKTLSAHSLAALTWTQDQWCDNMGELGNELLGLIQFNLQEAKLSMKIGLPQVIRAEDGVHIRPSVFMRTLWLEDTRGVWRVSFGLASIPNSESLSFETIEPKMPNTEMEFF